MQVPCQSYCPCSGEFFVCSKHRRTVKTAVHVHQVSVVKRIATVEIEIGGTAFCVIIGRLAAFCILVGKSGCREVSLWESHCLETFCHIRAFAYRSTKHGVNLMFLGNQLTVCRSDVTVITECIASLVGIRALLQHIHLVVGSTLG